MIEKVTSLNSLKKLRILSLGRNYIKSFAGMVSYIWWSHNTINILSIIYVKKSLSPRITLLLKRPLKKEDRLFNALNNLSSFFTSTWIYGRNCSKECLGDTLEELWISYNLVEKLKGINVLRNLKVLYMSNNLVKEWSEFNKLQVCLTTFFWQK